MSASPFRSHLLQQWARTNQKRPPVAVVPWLKPTSSSGKNNLDESEEDHRHIGRHRRHHDDGGRRHHRHHRHSSGSHRPPSLSTVDSNSSFASSPSSSWTDSRRSGNSNRKNSRCFSSSSAVASVVHPTTEEVDEAQDEGKSQSAKNETFSKFQQDKNDMEQKGNDNVEIDGDNDGGHEDDTGYFPSSFQSLLIDRRTATRLTFTDPENAEIETQHILKALDRAVQCAQMAPNHKRTEPFSIKRFLASSQAAQDLAEISYQVTLAKTESIPNAEGKRKKWLAIPAFLVTLVHDNQNAIEYPESSASSPYEALPFCPPQTERQLEDYASASAAIQNILLSLHSEGIGSKWATGPVIRTRAFRELVQASPTDRIVGLIMVGGSTTFNSEREEHITAVRRQRRRSLHGDLLQDLP